MCLSISFNFSWFDYVGLHSKPCKNMVWVVLFKHKAMQYSDSSNILCNKNPPLCLLSLQPPNFQSGEKKNPKKLPALFTPAAFSCLSNNPVCKMWLFSRLSLSGAVCVESSWSHWPKTWRQALITGLSASCCLCQYCFLSARFLSSHLSFTTSLPIFCLCSPVCQLPASPVSGTQGGILQSSAPYHWNLPAPEPECASNH